MNTACAKIFLFFLLGCIMTCLIGCKKEGKDNVPKFALKITSDVKGIDEILLNGYLANGTKGIIGKGGPSSDGYTVYIDNPLSSIYLYNIKGGPRLSATFSIFKSGCIVL